MIPDHELMERVHAGDVEAFDELLGRYWPPLVAYAARLVGSRDAAEDVVQETMVRVWEQRAEWTPGRHLRAFLYRITRNRALNEQAKGRVRREWAERERHRPRPTEPSPPEIAEQNALRESIERAIEALPDRRREVFVLARYHGHSYSEIAELMGISRQTVANQMSAALDQLRTTLKPRLDEFAEGDRSPES